MANPTFTITAGGVDYTFVALPIPGTNGAHVIQRSQASFPQPVPNSGAPDAANYLGYRSVAQEAPFGVGLRTRWAKDRIYDMEADARWPRCCTLPRLPTTTTFPAGVTAVSFRGFCNAIGETFMFGFRASGGAGGEPILYFDGTNWADATFDADTGGNQERVTGMCEHQGKVFAISCTPGGSTTITSGTSATAWTDVVASVTGEGYFIVSDGKYLFAAFGTTASSIAVRRSADNGLTWVATDEVISTTAISARGLVVYGNVENDRDKDVWLSTTTNLYHLNVEAETYEAWPSSSYTPVLTNGFQYPNQAATGQLLATPHGVVWTDGPEVFLGHFDGQQRFVYESLGLNKDDGLPLAKQGQAAWVAYDAILDELAVGKGGDSASRNQSVYFYSFKLDLWYACMAKNSTANRFSWAGIYSSETAGVNKLHFSRENGVANDSEALFLDYISENPEVQTSCTFDTAGQVTRSRFDGGILLFRKAFFKGQYVANDLTSTETLSIQFATDGGSLGSAQASSTTALVQEFWTDGSATALGSSAYDIYDKITMARAA